MFPLGNVIQQVRERNELAMNVSLEDQVRLLEVRWTLTRSGTIKPVYVRVAFLDLGDFRRRRVIILNRISQLSYGLPFYPEIVLNRHLVNITQRSKAAYSNI